MKKIIFLLVYAALVLNILPATAQNYLYAMLVGDTAKLSVPGANGTIQWQKSPDSLNWTNITSATTNPQTIITDTSYSGKRYYRAKITDSLCPNAAPFYSSAIRHRILTNTSQVQIGNWFRGGIVFYIDGTGHGLIAATQDQSSSCQWGCFGTTITAANSNTNGAANTAAIVAFHDGLTNYYGNPTQCNSSNNGTVAAKLCDTLSLNGYTDWFLPAMDQLNLLYQQKNMVGGFANVFYWSSKEDGAGNAKCLGFANGYLPLGNKDATYYVRAVRAF